jgi:hypothetical protein
VLPPAISHGVVISIENTEPFSSRRSCEAAIRRMG